MQEKNTIYWGDDLSHELCPCGRLCGSEGSYVCQTALTCPEFRRWKIKELEAVKKDVYKRTGLK